MKKITAFFLALFPLIVIVLLFVSGMIVKDFNHVFVSSIEFTQDNWEPQYEQPTPKPENLTHQFHVNVLPFNATDPSVYYYSTDESVIQVDDEGLATVKDFGEAEIIAVAKENKSITASCPIKVWDDKIHRIDITNEAESSYLGYHESVHVDAKPVPYDDLDGSIDPTVYFEEQSGGDLLVTSDGQLTANITEGRKSGIKVQYHIDKQGKQPEKITGELSVNIGPGVVSVGFDEDLDAYTKDAEIDLFDHIITYPDNEGVSATAFKYESTNEDVATIDENGKITFKKPGESTFKATYKKNTDLVLERTIVSSCEQIADVAFNRYNFVDNYDNYVGEGKSPYIDKSNINWSIFPVYDDLKKNIEITSSNEDVISVETVSGEQRLKVNGIGYATLTAKAKIDDTITKIDNCVVHITEKIDPDLEPEDIFIKSNIQLPPGYVYPLRANVKLDALPTRNTKITWQAVDHIEYIDETVLANHEVLLIKPTIEDAPDRAEPIHIKATFHDVDGTEISTTLVVNWDESQSKVIKQIKVEDGANIFLEAGKKYEFVDAGGYKLRPSFDLEDFEYDSDTYAIIPKWGLNYPGMLLSYVDDWIPLPDVSINLVVKQDAVSILADDNYPYYTTDQDTILISQKADEQIENGQIGVYPTTAIRPDGKKYLPNYSFEFEDPETGTIIQDDNSCTVSFKKAGFVNVTASLGQTTESYIIKSTYHNLGKFSLVELTDGSEKPIQSGDTIELSPSAPERTFIIDKKYLSAPPTLLEEYYLEHTKCLSKECSCTPKVLADGTVQFLVKINPNAHLYGKDTIMIDVGGFVFYLNVVIKDPQITEFNLFYHGQKLKKGDDVNLSYTNKLDLNIESLPIIAPKQEIKAQLDGSTNLPIDENGKIELDNLLPDVQHSVVLSTGDGSYQETFKFDVKSMSEIDNFSIKEAKTNDFGETPNMLYFGCGATQCGLTVQIDNALIDESTIRDNFSFTIEEKTTENEPTIVNDRCIISGILPATPSNPGYEKNVVVSLKDKPAISKTYALSRDIVSRIVLPDHDNLKQSDQKGLQKVHVFGNQSEYSGEEGVVDFYRLPIDIYDYRNHKLESKTPSDRENKAYYYSKLNVHLRSAYHLYNDPEYDVDHDCLNIHFLDEDLYTSDEIYNNSFEYGYKNVNLEISTHSGFAHAEYSFVPVKGINMYCKEALKEYNSVVLQCNVGLEGATKDNIALDPAAYGRFYFGNIYGNGYTFNIHALHEKLAKDDYISFQTVSVFNTILQGTNDNVVAQFDSQLKIRGKDDGDFMPRNYAYNIIKNWSRGVFLSEVNGDVYIKNSLFYGNTLSSITMNGANDDDPLKEARCFLQDCVLFNCSSVAVSGVNRGTFYYKGFFDVYNFRGKDALKNILGYDFSFAWDVVVPILRNVGAVQIGADGREYINSMMALVDVNACFWDEESQTYIKSDHGLPGANEHIRNLVSLDVGIKPSLWGTLNPIYDATAPSYYDEFDERGNLRIDFLNVQLDKISRPTNRLLMLLFA